MLNIFQEMEAGERKIQSIVSEMKELYLKDPIEWAVLFSTGKDSSLQLKCCWDMLQQLAPEKRHKTIHVVTSDTLVETPMMSAYVRRTLNDIEDMAAKQKLPIKTHLATPPVKDRFFYKVIGAGSPPPTKKSRFRWCTDKLKIKPTNRIIKKIITGQPPFYDYDLLLLLGVRINESTNRKRSIEKHQLRDKFARHAELKSTMVYHPIKYVTGDELWNHLLVNGLPWGDIQELYAMYRDQSGECPMTQVDGKQQSSCGGSRNGCWTCCYLHGADKMLVHLIEAGHEEYIPLMEFKNLLLEMRNDCRYRIPFRKNVYKILDQEMTQTLIPLHDIPNTNPNNDPLYQPGSFTLEARIKLLQKLLYTQEITGFQLIDDEEIDAIIDRWLEEGWTGKREEIVVPKNWSYDGAVVLNEDGSLNKKETTNPNPIYRIQVELRESVEEKIMQLYERSRKKGFNLFYLKKGKQLEFVICRSDIRNQHEAEKYVNQYLDQILA